MARRSPFVRPRGTRAATDAAAATTGAAVAATWSLAAILTAAVALGWTDRLDRALSWGAMSARGTTVWKVVTTLGDPPVVMAAGALAALALWHLRGRGTGAAMAVLTAASWATTWLLKLAIGRQRPEGVLDPASPAYPSGHTLQSTVVYVGMVLLGAPGQRLVVLLGAAIALLVGVSRVALGVHHAMDVLGGWLIGAALVMTARDLRSNGRAARGGGRRREGPPDLPRPPAAP